MQLTDNILISGGAKGADSEFDKVAHENGHDAYHYVVMSRKGLKGQIFIPSDELYEKAKVLLIRTNQSLKRDLSNLNDYAMKLLMRNMIIAGKTKTAMYAVTHLVDGQIPGGTAWGIQCAIMLNRYPVFVFCQDQEKWFTWNKWRFVESDIIKPYEIYSGIGSRDLKESGRKAIKELYNV